jgi:hypothetical protein
VSACAIPVVWKYKLGRKQLLGTETLEFTAISTSTLISLLGNFGSSHIGLDNVSVTKIKGSSQEHGNASAVNPQGFDDVQSAIVTQPNHFLLI